MKHRCIATPDAPAAIGPYVQATALCNLIFTSGQIPLDPKTMEMVSSDPKDQIARVFDNLAAVLAAAGTGLDRVVKATVFVTDLGDFATLNAVYEKRFGSHKPARSTVQVAALPRGASVEIELVVSLA